MARKRRMKRNRATANVSRANGKMKRVYPESTAELYLQVALKDYEIERSRK